MGIDENLAAEFDIQTQSRLTALLYRNAGTSQVVNVLVASGVAYLGILVDVGAVAATWWLWMCAVSAWRYALARRFERAAPSGSASEPWRRRYAHGTVVASLSWLAGSGYIMWDAPDSTRFMIYLCLAGMAAGAVPILAPVNRIFRLYAVPILLGSALITFAYASTPVHWVFGGLSLVFLGAVLRSASALSETLAASIRLGLEKAHLAEHLELARRAADAASLAKSRFLATMSHEIRTPMNGILGMAQLLLEPGLPDTEREDYARTVLTCGKSLMHLLNDILDLSKIEAGKIALETIAFEPERILHETLLLFAEEAEAKQLELSAQWHGEATARYLGDAHRVRQMLNNLANNAVKFTHRGHIRIDAREILLDERGATLEFAVADTGIGIPADKLGLLFQPFSQADSSTTREYGGTGLGLSIVRSLARQMEGEAGVESEAGEGSRFWFRIRVGRSGAGEDTRRAPRT